jgi:NAD(P)-dependent dehydrogenase (short-subunit alcohol dehydrogenase family)
MRVKDKTAIVVGGAGGIGKAICNLLASEGAQVMVADIDIDAANAVVDEIQIMGHSAIAMKVDITLEEETNAMAAAALERFGKIDILANVAGGSKGRFIRDAFEPFAASTKKMWDRIIDINLNGARNCTRSVINHMIERREGKIVSIASLAGVQGVPNAVDYSAAKAGIIGFTKALAKEMEPFGIQVNCISPGGVATERMIGFAKARMARGDTWLDPEKMTKPEEIANIVLLLVSGEAGHLIGENIIIAGLESSSERK